jgi:hypothetical protein
MKRPLQVFYPPRLGNLWGIPILCQLVNVGTGGRPQGKGSSPRAHQQALTIGPFGNTCEVDAVSPEAVMRGLQDIDVYNQREYQVDLTPQQRNIHISLIILDLLCTSTYQI